MSRPSTRTTERAALGVLVLFTVLAVAGYGVFGLNPQRLPDSELARGIFTTSWALFARLHVLLALAVLGVVLVARTGARFLVPLAAVFVVSFLAEHIGTGYGLPFGSYEYTGLLGPRVGERVPVLIPLSWFSMSIPAWVMARAVVPGRSAVLRRAGLGALWLVAWDLALDPAMSHLVPYWRWLESGPYYGMPWANLPGWFLTGLLLVALLDRLAGYARLTELPVRWMVGYFATVALMPLGMLAVAQEGPAVVATLTALSVLWALSLGVVGSGRVAARVPRTSPGSAT